VLAEWDGEPNGLAVRSDGMLLVADYKEGLVSHNGARPRSGLSSFVQLLCDPNTGTISPFLTRRNLERFKGTNDLVVSSKGEICELRSITTDDRKANPRRPADFTDQGQTGMTDPTGHVYRLNPDGKLDTLVTNGPSPNGIVLTPDEKVRCIAAWSGCGPRGSQGSAPGTEPSLRCFTWR
jgi:gluconolactonase